MKQLLKYTLFAAAVLMLWSCEKDENQNFFEGGTPPTLSANTTGPLVLNIADKDDPAITLSWTNPQYKFSTGLSSQSVLYTIQIDTTGSNFTNPSIGEVSVTADLSKTFTIGELNTALLAMGLVEDMPHDVEMRVKSTLSGGTGPLYSNAVNVTITPYLDVVVPVPTNGDLWITGDAVSSGWSNPLGAPFDVSQKFTRVTSSLYELTLQMNGGGGYKLIQDNGNWSTQYHMTTGTWSSGFFELRDSDPQFPGPLAPGVYTISVNFKTGKYSVTQ